MAVTITLGSEGVKQDLMNAIGTVVDATNVGELITCEFSGLPDGRYYVIRAVIRTNIAPSTIPSLTDGQNVECALHENGGRNWERTYGAVKPLYTVTDADGAPEFWVAQFDHPFSRTLENNGWTVQFVTPPADANASPISQFFASFTLGFERTQ